MKWTWIRPAYGVNAVKHWAYLRANGQGLEFIGRPGRTSWGPLPDVAWSPQMEDNARHYLGDDLLNRVPTFPSRVDYETRLICLAAAIRFEEALMEPPRAAVSKIECDPVSEGILERAGFDLKHLAAAPALHLHLSNGETSFDASWNEVEGTAHLSVNIRRGRRFGRALQDLWRWNARRGVLSLVTEGLPKSLIAGIAGKSLALVSGDPVHEGLVIQSAVQGRKGTLDVRLDVRRRS